MSTGIMLYSNQWKKGRATGPDAFSINSTIESLLTKVRQVILQMVEEKALNIFLIPEKLNIDTLPKLSFKEFCYQRADVLKYGKSRDSQERYNRFLKFFFEWGKIVEFKDITDKRIIEYDAFLKSKHMKNTSKWNNYHRFLNTFILDAIEAGHLKKNPYKWIEIDKGKEDSIHKCLTPEEVHRLSTAEMGTESLERVRDVFLFQTYTCLSYTDLKDFKASEIKEARNMKVYIGERIKTHKTFTIPLLPPAIEILEKYNYHLPIISNVKYNAYLKVVAQSAKIDKPLTSHWARHTGATLLLNKGIDMQIVSKICGHSSIKITEQVYAKLLDKTIIDAVSKITL